MSNQTVVYMRLTGKGDKEITPILVQTVPENIDNL